MPLYFVLNPPPVAHIHYSICSVLYMSSLPLASVEGYQVCVCVCSVCVCWCVHVMYMFVIVHQTGSSVVYFMIHPLPSVDDLVE